MDIVLGILILLALCGSRAAKQGLTLLIGIPLGVLAAFMLVGMLGSIPQILTAHWPARTPAPVSQPVFLSDREAQDRSCAAWTLAVLRYKDDSAGESHAMAAAYSQALQAQRHACTTR